ncbi:MAG TPA: DNA primase [Myxococcaceae bacterium]|nr:DNA primase [Myxococcaceae bacterium]
MLIPEHKIEEVLERVDLVALIGRHVELKKSGRSFKGRCPFHEEKSPSFYVTPELRRFKCFGCQVGGDAIAFVQRYQGKSFVDAVRELAREVGVDLATAEDPAARERQQLREVTALAQGHFERQLWEPGEGRTAREALAARGVSEDTARAFGLGWASTEWTRLSDELLRQGMLEFGIQAGLVQRRPRADGTYDVFRGRLMIPIRAPDGRTLAFGGRLLVGDQGPKYLNSRDSRLYSKGEVLYALDMAQQEIRRQHAAVLVEGYFDAIALHQAGVRNAVALCSTALTPGHLEALRRAEARDLVLLLDGDEAGRTAVERLAGPLLAAATSTRVALLPEGEDPDTFARSQGADGVRSLLAGARPLSEHLVATVLPERAGASFERKMEALGRLRPVLAQLPVGLVRSAFLSTLARAFALPAAELEAALRGRAGVLRPVPRPPGAAAPQRRADAVEAALVAAALRDPGLVSGRASRAADELSHPALRTVVARLQAGADPLDAVEGLAPGLRDLVEAQGRALPTDGTALLESFTRLAQRLELRRIDEALAHIARVTGTLASAHELDEETRRLQAERVELLGLRRRVLGDAQPPGRPP